MARANFPWRKNHRPSQRETGNGIVFPAACGGIGTTGRGLDLVSAGIECGHVSKKFGLRADLFAVADEHDLRVGGIEVLSCCSNDVKCIKPVYALAIRFQ